MPACLAKPLSRHLPRLLTGKGGALRMGVSSGAAQQDTAKGLFFQKELNVPTYGGSLSVRSPFDVSVRPLGALEYPNLDRAFVRMRADAEHAANVDGRANATVEVGQDGAVLRVSSRNVGVPDNLVGKVRKEVQVPMVYSLDVAASGAAAVDVCDFIESDYCRITSGDGDVTVSGVKTARLEVETTGSGDVTCSGSIQGNVKVKTAGGNVIGDRRFTGPSLEIATDTGDIRLASCYSDTSHFYTNKGSMHLRNVHNESYVAVYEKGKVVIQGLDGCANIFVKKGEIDCQVSMVRDESRIHIEEGDVHLRISEDQPLKIHVEANDVLPDANFKASGRFEDGGNGRKVYDCSLHPNRFSAVLLVIAENGNVVLESQDWAASLGLKMAPHPPPPPANNKT